MSPWLDLAEYGFAYVSSAEEAERIAGKLAEMGFGVKVEPAGERMRVEIVSTLPAQLARLGFDLRFTPPPWDDR
jgi:hypothetical protein